MGQQAARLKVRKTNGLTIVKFSDRKILDELCILEIQEELERLVSAKTGGHFLLSFMQVEHLSSAALAMLITLKKQVEKENGKLKLSDINPQIFEVFKITRLNKLFDIHTSTDEAMASF